MLKTSNYLNGRVPSGSKWEEIMKSETAYSFIKGGASDSEWREIVKSLKRGRDSFRTRQYQEALDFFNAALRLRPNDALLWFDKARSLHGMDRLEEAIDCYETALGIRQDDNQNTLKFLVWKDDWDNRLMFLCLEGKANCLMQAGRWDESEKCFEDARQVGIRTSGNREDIFNAWYAEL
jgi:tetratricopeptide (TPR) repeat protein